MRSPKCVSACLVALTLAATLRTRSLSAQESAHAQLLASDRRLSDSVYLDGIAKHFPAALGSWGTLLWPGAELVAGDSTVIRFFAHQPLLADAKISWQPLRVEISHDSTLAFIIGVVVADRPETGPINAIHRIGRYLAVWRRSALAWRLEAFELVNVFAAGETIWTNSIGPSVLPAPTSSGSLKAFLVADSVASADAGATTIGTALSKWAAPDGMTFAYSGELNIGPKRIGEVLAANNAHWHWTTVVAAASTDGSLGWTAGLVDVTPAGGGTIVGTKYLTLWRRGADGGIRFVARASNPRP